MYNSLIYEKLNLWQICLSVKNRFEIWYWGLELNLNVTTQLFRKILLTNDYFFKLKKSQIHLCAPTMVVTMKKCKMYV